MSDLDDAFEKIVGHKADRIKGSSGYEGYIQQVLADHNIAVTIGRLGVSAESCLSTYFPQTADRKSTPEKPSASPMNPNAQPGPGRSLGGEGLQVRNENR
ncbi:MAG: hypothetical protein P8Z79_24030 [Sedimentisphaerales bacterium]